MPLACAHSPLMSLRPLQCLWPDRAASKSSGWLQDVPHPQQVWGQSGLKLPRGDASPFSVARYVTQCSAAHLCNVDVCVLVHARSCPLQQVVAWPWVYGSFVGSPLALQLNRRCFRSYCPSSRATTGRRRLPHLPCPGHSRGRCSRSTPAGMRNQRLSNSSPSTSPSTSHSRPSRPGSRPHRSHPAHEDSCHGALGTPASL